MCIRDREEFQRRGVVAIGWGELGDLSRYTDREELRDEIRTCLLYTSDAADERSSVDLGGRRIIKKKKSQ